jgi:hypothetical protein
MTGVVEVQEGVLVPKYGGYSECISVLENEHRISHLLRIADVIDQEFGVSSACDVGTLMPNVLKTDCKLLTIVSGYAHLLVAEHMNEQGFDKPSINREIDKAEALLDYAHLGGNHPWLPRAQWLKRRVNWREYLNLGFTIGKLLCVIVFCGMVYRFFSTSDVGFF